MKDPLLLSHKRRLRGLAPPLLLLPLLMATATAARADGDLIDYHDAVRFHDELAACPNDGHATRASTTCVVYLLHVTAHRPAARVIVRADRPRPAAGGGYFISFPNAEATAAAASQTVNRATNDLD